MFCELCALDEPSQSDALVTRGKFLLCSWNVPESSPAQGRRTVGLGFGSCSGSAHFWPRVCVTEPVGRGAHRKIVELRDLHPPENNGSGGGEYVCSLQLNGLSRWLFQEDTGPLGTSLPVRSHQAIPIFVPPLSSPDERVLGMQPNSQLKSFTRFRKIIYLG